MPMSGYGGVVSLLLLLCELIVRLKQSCNYPPVRKSGALSVFEVVGYVVAAVGVILRHVNALLAAREQRVVEVVVRLFSAELKAHEQRIADLERKLGVATARDEKRTGDSA